MFAFNPSCLFAVFACIPLTATAQQLQPAGRGAFTIEIPATRAAAQPQIDVLLTGTNATQPRSAELRKALVLIGKECLNCSVTVKNNPPVIAPGIVFPTRNGINFDAIAMSAPESVAKAEDCPIAKPFYVLEKKRCYTAGEFLISAGLK